MPFWRFFGVWPDSNSILVLWLYTRFQILFGLINSSTRYCCYNPVGIWWNVTRLEFDLCFYDYIQGHFLCKKFVECDQILKWPLLYTSVPNIILIHQQFFELIPWQGNTCTNRPSERLTDQPTDKLPPTYPRQTSFVGI